MKHLGLILLLVLGISLVQPQSTTWGNSQFLSTVGTDSKPRLELTLAIVKGFSCSPELFTLRMRFTFKNTGSGPVMVHKRSFLVRSLVSTSPRAAAAGKYIMESRGDMWGMFPFRPTDLSNFAILGPGEVYALDDERESFFVSDDPANPHRRLRPGNYFLQVEVVTWPYLDKPRPFRNKWKDTGYLWSEGITSQPMPFTIEKNRPIVSCP